MLTSVWILGIFAFGLSTITRWIAIKNGLITKNRNLIGHMSKDELLVALGQLAGVTWIAIGFITTLFDIQLPTGFLGNLIGLFLMFSPFFIVIIGIRILKAHS